MTLGPHCMRPRADHQRYQLFGKNNQEISRPENGDTGKGVQYQQILVATDDKVGPTSQGHLEELVFLRVSGYGNALLRGDRFPAQQNEANQSLDGFVSQSVFVANARPVEHVDQLLQE
jgi:hypothetical protein